MSRSEDIFKPALQGKKIPVLTLDHKWHRLFTQAESNEEIEQLKEQLHTLVKRQGKLTTETKDIKRLKKKLMDEIVELADELGQSTNKLAEKRMEDNKRLINECNDKLEAYQDELMDLPKNINEVNQQLMVRTMEVCYDRLKENSAEIEETAKWITEMRIELKKKLIRKQEKEQDNHNLYSYMHDIFGAEVIEIFDMKYFPDPLKRPGQKESVKEADGQEKTIIKEGKLIKEEAKNNT